MNVFISIEFSNHFSRPTMMKRTILQMKTTEIGTIIEIWCSYLTNFETYSYQTKQTRMLNYYFSRYEFYRLDSFITIHHVISLIFSLISYNFVSFKVKDALASVYDCNDDSKDSLDKSKKNCQDNDGSYDDVNDVTIKSIIRQFLQNTNSLLNETQGFEWISDVILIVRNLIFHIEYWDISWIKCYNSFYKIFIPGYSAFFLKYGITNIF